METNDVEPQILKAEMSFFSMVGKLSLLAKQQMTCMGFSSLFFSFFFFCNGGVLCSA